MKKLLLIFVMMATWIVVSCATPTIGNGGCWGFWSKGGPKKGTLEKNKFNTHPYRQCVDEEFPHKDLERRPFG